MLRRVARVTDMPVARIKRMLVTCGEDGAVPGLCWNGTPLQPVPIAVDVPQPLALRVLEQPEDFPSVLADQQSLRDYPRPYGINLAHVLGYLSPITGDELDQAEDDGDRSVNGASVVGRAGVEKQYDAWLRGMPGYTSVKVDSMGRAIGDDAPPSVRPTATHWSPRSMPRCRASSSGSSPRPSAPRGRPTTR